MYLQWICVTEVMSYCDVLEPSHVLTVEGDCVTSDEGLDFVCMLTKPCSWLGDLLPFSQIPVGRRQCYLKILYLIQNQYINCSMVTGSSHTWGRSQVTRFTQGVEEIAEYIDTHH